MTDDQDLRSLAKMPRVRSLLVDQGASFRRAFASTPQCCPSRVAFLRGQYTHNHGVLTNFAPHGGYKKARVLNVQGNTVATWLDKAGYVTAYGGKYLNEYYGPEIPPGWDRWWGYTRKVGNAAGFYVNDNGTERWVDRLQLSDPDYLAQKAETFIKDRGKGGPPFFLVLAPSTPHHPYFHAERHARFFSTLKAPRTPNFNELDTSDKPRHVRLLPRYDGRGVSSLDEKYRDRLRGLQGVDEMVDRTVRTLAQMGKLSNTYVVYVSDNGYLLGEHRFEGKDFPYEESIRVPFVVRGPGIPAGAQRDEIVANVDWAPTIADWAGVPTPSFVDGRAIGPLFSSAPPPWRKRLLLEYYLNGDAVKPFKGLRTADDQTYVEHVSGEREFYDLRKDPYQVQNAYRGMDPTLRRSLETELGALRGCAAAECRSAEGGE